MLTNLPFMVTDGKIITIKGRCFTVSRHNGPISVSVIQIGTVARSSGINQVQLIIERNQRKYYILQGPAKVAFQGKNHV